MEYFGIQAAAYIVIQLFCLVLTWWALQSVRFGAFIRNPEKLRTKVLMILITVVMAYIEAKFLMDYYYSAIQISF